MKKCSFMVYVCMMLVVTTILPASGIIEDHEAYEIIPPSIEDIYTQLQTVHYESTIALNPKDPQNTIVLDIFEIYEGQYLKVTLTGQWNPPNPTKTICLWANDATIPTGATFTPPCNCAPGEVTSIFEWTPAVGQAGTYVVTWYLGESCYVPLGSYTFTIIVHPTGSDNPPLVIIASPPDGSTFNDPEVTVTGYATDDHGIVSYGKQHEWIGDQQATSGTLPTPVTTYAFSEQFTLREGWNRITIFVSDTHGQPGQDQIVIYYAPPSNQPPNKPTTPSGPSSGKTGESLHFETYVSDPDADSMEVMFDWGDGNITGWIGPIVSGTSVGNYHTYTIDGTYQVKVKARDLPHLEESPWSDPLQVTTPKIHSYNPLAKSMERMMERFSFLHFLLWF